MFLLVSKAQLQAMEMVVAGLLGLALCSPKGSSNDGKVLTLPGLGLCLGVAMAVAELTQSCQLAPVLPLVELGCSWSVSQPCSPLAVLGHCSAHAGRGVWFSTEHGAQNRP